MSRRLVPMPKRRRPSGEPAATQPPLAPLKTWHSFAFLIVAAIVLYYAKWPILIIAALVGFFYCLFWLCHRFPRTMFVISAIVRGLLGGRRR